MNRISTNIHPPAKLIFAIAVLFSSFNFLHAQEVQRVYEGQRLPQSKGDFVEGFGDTYPVIIDGTTQPGFSGIPIIELNGGSAL